jgi:hypothetical protein
MLAKLLKYELPAMGRKLLPLYAAWAVTAVFLGISTQSSASKSDFIAVMSILLYTAIATAIVVMSVIMIVQRYSRSLLGEEAYFNQTLPVSAAAHIGNKLISATVWISVTALVALLTGFLILIGMGFIVGFDSFKAEYIDIPKGFWGLFLEMIILIIASIVKSVMQIYAAVTIGHQAQNHTTLTSIGAYIAVLVFEGSAGRIVMGLIPSMTKLVYGAEELYGPDGMLNFTGIFIPALLATAVFAAIYFFICKYLMEKRLNLA